MFIASRPEAAHMLIYSFCLCGVWSFENALRHKSELEQDVRTNVMWGQNRPGCFVLAYRNFAPRGLWGAASDKSLFSAWLSRQPTVGHYGSGSKHLPLSAGFLTDKHYLWMTPDQAQIPGYHHKINSAHSSQTRAITQNEIKGAEKPCCHTGLLQLFCPSRRWVFLSWNKTLQGQFLTEIQLQKYILVSAFTVGF